MTSTTRKPTEGLPVVFDDTTGEIATPPATYGLVCSGDDDDPWNEQVLQTTNAEGWTHEVAFSRRLSQPTRWNGTLSGVTQPLLRRVDCGQEFGFNERWRENFNTVNEREHNPTFGGAILKPEGYGTVKLYPSPPIYQRAWTDGEQIVCEGAVIPLEFDSYGGEVATHASKLGDINTPGIYPRMRMFQRVHYNWSGIANVHRVEMASYFPREIAPWLTDWVGILIGGAYVPDWYTLGGAAAANNAWFYYPEADINNSGGSDTIFSVATGDANDWAANDAVTFRSRSRGKSVIGGGSTDYANPNIGRRSHTAAVLQNVTFDLFYGLVGKTYAESHGQRRATEIRLQQQRNAAHPAAATDTNSGQILGIASNGAFARAAGWVSLQYFLVTCQGYANFRGKVRQLSASGVLDQPFRWSSIPEPVLRGTAVPNAGD